MKVILALLTLAGVASAETKVITKEISYQINGQPFKGFLAMPEGTNKVSGVLVVHEWWGHNEYTRKRAKMLAELGYAAFALDMYGNGKSADNPKDAGALAGDAMKSGQIRARFEGAMKALKDEPRVDQSKLAAIGYCFGGNVVLSMAEAGEPLKAAVSFHGSLPKGEDIKKNSVKANVLILHGGADEFVSTDAVKKYEGELKAANANVKVVVYPGAKHAFTNPDASQMGEMHKIPIAYDKSADEKSWSEMKSLFKKVL